MENWKLQSLPLNRDVESKDVLRALLGAHTALAELRAVAETIPNQHILINTLTLEEAKDSSAVENIITTHDELYRYELSLNLSASPHAKEVQSYVSAVKRGYELIRKTEMLTTKSIIEIQQDRKSVV